MSPSLARPPLLALLLFTLPPALSFSPRRTPFNRKPPPPTPPPNSFTPYASTMHRKTDAFVDDASKGRKKAILRVLRGGRKRRRGGGTAAAAAAAGPAGAEAAGAAGAAGGGAVGALSFDINGTHSILGNTALQAAANFGREEVVDILLEHGADTDARRDKTEDTALHLAAGAGRVAIVHKLLSVGANKHIVNRKGETPVGLVCALLCCDALSSPLLSSPLLHSALLDSTPHSPQLCSHPLPPHRSSTSQSRSRKMAFGRCFATLPCNHALRSRLA